MTRGLAFRLILLAALLGSLLRVVIAHSAHVGPLEWAVVTALGVALLASLIVGLRRAA